MNLSKREFMQVLGAGVMAGLPMGSYAQKAAGDAEGAMACRQQIETLPPTDK